MTKWKESGENKNEAWTLFEIVCRSVCLSVCLSVSLCIIVCVSVYVTARDEESVSTILRVCVIWFGGMMRLS